MEEVHDKLMGLTVSELTKVKNFINNLMVMKSKSALSVGAKVYIVQKTKKTLGIVKKINQSRAVVEISDKGEMWSGQFGRDYNVPFSMLEVI